MDNILQDIRFGFRMLIKSPTMTIAAVVSLALTIAANGAVFSVVNAVLLNPLPFKDPDRLVRVWGTIQKEGDNTRPVSYPEFQDWRSQCTSFEDMSALFFSTVSLTEVGNPERISCEFVSASYFSLLGVQPFEGRTFRPEEDTTPDKNPVVLISYQMWQTHFGSDPGLINNVVKLNERSYTVIGIMPDGFHGVSGDAQVWLPIVMISAIRPASVLQARNARWHQVIARLKPDVTVKDAGSEMEIIAANMAEAYPQTNNARGATAVSIIDEIIGNLRPSILILFAIVNLVLLIACVNIANLLIARAARRQREIALRIVLGADRKRLIQQLLTESLLLSLIGGIVGVILAFQGIKLLVAMMPDELPDFVNIEMDFWVFGFSFFVTILTGVIFGLVPALQISKTDLNSSLNEGTLRAGRSNRRISNYLVAVEIALAAVLLLGAGLMIKSLQQIQTIDAGFNPDRLLTMTINLPAQRYSKPQASNFSSELVERIKILPSVQQVSLSSDVPLGEDSSSTNITVEGEPEPSPGSEIRAFRHRVMPGFFSTLQIPLQTGRDFTAQDNVESDKVVIVDRSLAARIWPGQDALGKRIKIGGAQAPWLTVVGVAGDAKYFNLIQTPDIDMDIYLPLFQDQVLTLYFAIRSSGDPSSLVSAVRREVRMMEPNLPVYSITTMEQRMTREIARFRFITMMLIVFGLVALVMASIGVYGVMSYAVSQRTQEIGIRMALGAQKSQIFQLVMKQGIIVTVIGLVIGLVGSFALTRFLTSLLYGVSATDPIVFVLTALILMAVTLIACFIPARRAVAVDPAITLRQE